MLEPQTQKHVFENVPILSSERLRLRGIEPADVSSIIDLSVYDGVFAQTEADALRILEQINLDRKNGEGIQWAILLKDQADIVGICSYHRGYPNNMGEIGYVLKPAYRGQGIMTEAVKLIVKFGLEVMKLTDVVAYVDSENRASVRVLERAGFHQVEAQEEGLTFAFQRV